LIAIENCYNFRYKNCTTPSTNKTLNPHHATTQQQTKHKDHNTKIIFREDQSAGLQIFLYLQKKHKNGERERENARKVREKARNSDFNIISFLLYIIFSFSPFAHFRDSFALFRVLSPPFASIKKLEIILIFFCELVANWS
jgi:hypothetical protein